MTVCKVLEYLEATAKTDHENDDCVTICFSPLFTDWLWWLFGDTLSDWLELGQCGPDWSTKLELWFDAWSQLDNKNTVKEIVHPKK